MENQHPANEKNSRNKVNKSDSLQSSQPSDMNTKGFSG